MTIIRNGRVIRGGEILNVDVAFEDGKIVKITMKGGNEEGTFEANVTISKYGTTASLPAPEE